MKIKNAVFSLALACVLISSVSLLNAQRYKKDEESVRKLNEKGKTLSDEQKAMVRADIVKIAKILLKRNVKYGYKSSLFHPRKKRDISYRIDCSGFVFAVYTSANISVFEKQAVVIRGANGVKIIYDTFKKFNKIYKSKTPGVGDIIFFDNTWDKNKNGRLDDELTHTGIVTDVAKDGTITYIHASSSKGLVRAYANLNKAHTMMYKGKVINTPLRRKRKSDPKGTAYYSGALINSFATVLDVPEN